MSDAASSGSQDATSSSLRRPALPDRNASQHTVSGMNNQLGQMLRSAALMYDGRQQDSAGQDSSSSSSSSSEEDEDDDGDAKNEALKANRAEAGEASRSSLEWSLRKEEAALADAKDRKHRKAIFEKMDGLRRRKAALPPQGNAQHFFGGGGNSESSARWSSRSDSSSAVTEAATTSYNKTTEDLTDSEENEEYEDEVVGHERVQIRVASAGQRATSVPRPPPPSLSPVALPLLPVLLLLHLFYHIAIGIVAAAAALRFYIRASRLQPLTSRNVSSVEARLAARTSRSPKHVALILAPPPPSTTLLLARAAMRAAGATLAPLQANPEERRHALVAQLRDVARWCALCGTPRLTVYDPDGLLADCFNQTSEWTLRWSPSDVSTTNSTESRLLAPVDPGSSPTMSDSFVSFASASSGRSEEEEGQKHGAHDGTATRAHASGQRTDEIQLRIEVLLPGRKAQGTSRGLGDGARHLQLHVLGPQDGKGALVQASKHLVEEALDGKNANIDIARVDEILQSHGYPPEPDLLVLHGGPRRVCSLHGFPPWSLRITEIFYDARAHPRLPISAASFEAALDCFAASEQRHGRLRRKLAAKRRGAVDAGSAARQDCDESSSGFTKELQRSALEHLDDESAEHRSIMSAVTDSSDGTKASGDLNDADRKQGSGGEVPVDPKARLEALRTTFGDSGMDGTEVFIANCPAVLTRRVMIKGTLIVTTHRLCFIAHLTSEDAAAPTDPHAGATPRTKSNVIKRGPATLHRPGLHRRSKAWFELTADALTAYSSSTSLYNPLGSARLAEIDDLLPHHWGRPNCVDFRIKGRRIFLEFDTEEASLAWHREIEAALWRFKTTAEEIRVSLPLCRILSMTQSTYLAFAVALWLNVLDDSRNEGEKDASATIELSFGVTRGHESFLKELYDAHGAATRWRQEVGIDAVLLKSPSPMLDIEGPQSREVDLTRSASGSDGKSLAARITQSFGLRCKPDELRLVKAEIFRAVPMPGTIALSPDHFIFWRTRLGPLPDTRLKIPLSDLQGVEAERSFRWRTFGLRVHIRGYRDEWFDFSSQKDRDAMLEALNGVIAKLKQKEFDHRDDASVKRGISKVSDATRMLTAEPEQTLSLTKEQMKFLPKVVNVSADVEHNVRRLGRLRIALMTIGSRGDVQPLIGLALELKKHGHAVFICSHPEYRDWVEGKFGIEYRGMGGDPAALMKLSVEHRMFSPGFFKESVGKFRGWLDELFREAFEAAYDADVIMESPSTFAGIHVAEATGAAYFRMCTMCWNKTAAYPQAFSVPPVDLGPAYNTSSYVLFDAILWRAMAGQVNRWRKHMLHLGPTDLTKLAADTIPTLYNFSPSVVPPPLDWGDRILVSGYWNVETATAEKWEAPESMIAFMKAARRDERKIAYIGFGSIVVPDARAVSKAIYEAVVRAGVRAIVSKGWSERTSDGEKKATEETEEIPEECYVVQQVPHDWLFPRIDMAFHHGGAGTTGASLRAGLPTLIHPFFGDQFFWSQRVHKLGAGLRVENLSASDISDALVKAQHRIIVEKAQAVGERIRVENGPADAVKFIYHNLSIAQRKRVPLRDNQPRRRVSLPNVGLSSLPTISIGSGSAKVDGHFEGISEHAEEEVEMDAGDAHGPTNQIGGDSIPLTEEPLEEELDTPTAVGDRPKRQGTLGSLHLPRALSAPFHLPGKRRSKISSTQVGALPLDHSTAPTLLEVGTPISPSHEEWEEEGQGTAGHAEEVRRTHKTAKAEDVRRRELLEEQWKKDLEEMEKAEGNDDATGWSVEHKDRVKRLLQAAEDGRVFSNGDHPSNAVNT